MTPRGFYSVVRNRDADSYLLIRARAREDLERLCEIEEMNKYATEIVDTPPPTADYGYRIWRVLPDDWTAALETMTSEITYGNFKKAIEPKRASVYMRVWSALLSIGRGRPAWDPAPQPALDGFEVDVPEYVPEEWDD
jgi:hypothetical protein